ncbi:MAG: phosphodiester glycosidase family protein [Bacteroidales bacterium]|nr:phosphodiester glycosidase family protein [Bacteroidales bacterium]
MKKCIFLVLLVFSNPFLKAQEINWEDISAEHSLPEGLKLFHGTLTGNSTFFAYYFEVDMNNPDIAVRPYLKPNSVQVNAFTDDVGAYAAINGGFFSGSSSVSSIIYPGEVPARNLISVTRTVSGVTQTYPVIRPVFALNADRTLATEWVYHHSYNFDDIYVYEEPLQYICEDPNPLPVPLKADGFQYEDIAYGIGGGPMLIKDGEINIDYCEGVWWGSGVFLTDFRPRTAVGFTAEKKVIMFVTNSMKIGDVAQELLDLGCVGAMNLDGGGSTAMAVGNQSIYTQGRAVPSILAVVHSDSLNIPAVPTFEKFFDTGDEGVYFQGNWFNTANPGSWESPSRLHALGTHDDFYHFPLNLPGPGEYEVYGWWTAHSNRATNTPFIITHADGETETTVNQSIGGSMWNLVGTFNFNGTENESVRITAAATTNEYVVADGLRIVSYDPDLIVYTIASIEPVDDIEVPWGTLKDDALALLSTQTTITDSHNRTHVVDLQWTVENYDAETSGDYLATGTFELPDGVTQSNPETPLEVTANITVLQDDTSIGGNNLSGLKVYPNPSKSKFTVSGISYEPLHLEVFSLDGRLLQSHEAGGRFSIELNLEGFSPGIYLLRASGKSGVRVIRVVKE